MTDSWLPANKIVEGDAVETLAKLPDSSIHMAMCSPPYYGLRDYGEDGQIGLEDSLDEYIDRLVNVGEELRRVLRDDGSWWLNIGDSFCTRRRARKSGSEQDIAKAESERTNEDYSPDGDGDGRYHNASLMDHSAAFVDKDKMLVPHRTAIALQEAGWVVRNDTVWRKTNPMPDSAEDRFSTTFEYLFFLTPNRVYWSDFDAIREPYQTQTTARAKRGRSGGDKYVNGPPGQTPNSIQTEADEQGGLNPLGKNPGDVFELPTANFGADHFAAYPEELCEKPIKAACPKRTCPECGKPYNRLTEKTGEFVTTERGSGRNRPRGTNHGRHAPQGKVGAQVRRTVGWEAGCTCEAGSVKPGIALDPFAGTGTTCAVAKRLGRRFVGIDLNPEYVAIAQARVGITVDNPEYLITEGQSTLKSIATTD